MRRELRAAAALSGVQGHRRQLQPGDGESSNLCTCLFIFVANSNRAIELWIGDVLNGVLLLITLR